MKLFTMSPIYSEPPINQEDTEAQFNPLQILSNRLDELESKFSYQENTIDILNETILKQQLEIDRLKQYIQKIVMRLQANERTDSPTTSEIVELPPHY